MFQRSFREVLRVWPQASAVLAVHVCCCSCCCCCCCC